MSRVIGIDLGTSTSVVSVLEGGEPAVVGNAEGMRATPSVVAFAKNGELLVGESARRQAVTNVRRTLRDVKSHLGTDWTADVDGVTYVAPEIAARVLRKLKRDAETYLGEPVTRAVITVPASFTDRRRQAVRDAGRIAGLDVLRVVNEAGAAALAYGLDKGDAERTAMIFDLGGGCLDVSVVEIGDGVVSTTALAGDSGLGGDDWDQRLADHLVERFTAEHGAGVAGDAVARQRVLEAAESAKIALSHDLTTTVNLRYLMGEAHLNAEVSRAEFQRITADLVDRCRIPFEQVIEDAGMPAADLDHVVLVGGATRMPAIADLITELTGKAPNRSVNPDEIVAVGAALQAGVLQGEIKDLMLVDVAPLTLGIETQGGLMTRVIDRNTWLPTRRTEVFTTAEEGQRAIPIHLYQGERAVAASNTRVGTFELTGIPAGPARGPQLEVTFDVDANGIITVSARDLESDRTQEVTVTGRPALSEAEIARMRRDAEAPVEPAAPNPFRTD